MKKIALVGLFLSFALGCKKSAPANTETAAQAASPVPVSASAPSAPAAPASEWRPVVKGVPYQLSLKSGVLGFCDDSGSQQMDVATGRQTPGTQTCDAKHEVVQSNCDDQVQISGQPEGGNDDLAVNENDYILRGHSRQCDRDGKMVIVSTASAVEVIDGAANKVAFVSSNGGEQVVIGSGWVAWRSLEGQSPLHLETVAKAMEHATTPKV